MVRRIRKQVNELCAADFEAHPCWEYAEDEEHRKDQDECTVRPLALEALAGATQQVFVQAIFCFPNGRVRPGMVTLNAGSGPDGHQPVVFLPEASLAFYEGSLAPSASAVKQFVSALKKVSPTPWPVRYASALFTAQGAPLAAGSLDGLYWLVDWQTGALRHAAG
ncbi:MAG: hypothetical protein V4739_09845 [Pseudomonadota bacterium]